jgi:TolB-like protein
MTEGPEKTKVPRRLAAILAADIAGYSALMGADEADTVRSLKEHQAVVLPMIIEHGGRVIDTAGDGILAEFGSVVNAAECAVAIQRTMVERNAGVEETRRMRFRIGINQGDVVFDDTRVYGDGVNVAARLENLAEPGGICISRRVYEDISGKMQLAFVDLGQQLKNIAQPVRVYRVSDEQLAAARVAAKPALALPDKPSIAVLPFTNMSGDPEQEYFADGMVEEIITGLSRFRWLFVIARNSSFTFKGRAVDAKQVGRELGVRYLLEGSVRKSANRVRIAGQLIDASSGAHLWADRFEGVIENVFELQDQVTASVVGAIAPRLEQAESNVLGANQPKASMPTTCFCADRQMFTNGPGRKMRKRSACFTKRLNVILISPRHVRQQRRALPDASRLAGSSTERRRLPKPEDWPDTLSNRVRTMLLYSLMPGSRSPMPPEISTMALPSLTEPC